MRWLVYSIDQGGVLKKDFGTKRNRRPLVYKTKAGAVRCVERLQGMQRFAVVQVADDSIVEEAAQTLDDDGLQGGAEEVR